MHKGPSQPQTTVMSGLCCGGPLRVAACFAGPVARVLCVLCGLRVQNGSVFFVFFVWLVFLLSS